jgi:hypothetical protein
LDTNVWLCMMKRCLKSLVVLSVSMGVSSGLYALSETLYQARIPVADQSSEARDRSLALGLHAVLVKTTGQLSFEHPAVIAAMKAPKRFLSEYSYRPVLAEELVEGRYWLELRYSQSLTNQLIRQAELPFWGQNRKPTLVWLIIAEDGKRERVSDASNGPIAMAVTRRAQQRGLPLVFPAMDLKDAVALSDQSLWGLFADSIREASERYFAQQILAGRVSRNANGHWEGQWRFYLGDNVLSFKTQGADALSFGAQAVDQVASQVVELYAIKPSDGGAQMTQFEISNLSSSALLARCENYLKSLASVKSVSIQQMRGEKVVFDIQLNSNFEQFIRLVGADPFLTPDEGLSDFPFIEHRFQYNP